MSCLPDKRVCANCGHRHTEHKDPGYDHMEQDLCDAHGDQPCSDIWNTTCDDFDAESEKDACTESLAAKCYGIYKLRWLADHGTTLEELVSSIGTQGTEEWEKDRFDEAFGKDGAFYQRYHVFRNVTFIDYGLMRDLIGKNKEMFAKWQELTKIEGPADEDHSNIVYCNRDCENQEGGYCIDCGVAIDDCGYCTGYMPR